MDDKNIEEFYEKKPRKDEGEVTDEKHKRRKVAADSEALKNKARVSCSSVVEWNTVRKYKAEKLQAFIEEKKYEQSKEIENTVFDASHKILAVILDKLTQSDGFVQEQILRDLSLKKAIGVELQDFLVYLNNKIKIIVLTSINVFQGKNNQSLQAEPTIEVLPNDNDCGKPEDIDKAAVLGAD